MTEDTRIPPEQAAPEPPIPQETAPPAAADVPTPLVPDKTGRVIAIFGTKGGVGKTTLATSLAVSLTSTDTPAIVIDCDMLGMGDVSKILKLQAERSVVDIGHRLIDTVMPATIDDVDGITTEHRSGIAVLSLIKHPMEASTLAAVWIRPLINILRAKYAYIVLDLGRSFSEAVLSALDEANLVLLTLTPEIVALSQAKWSLTLLVDMLYPKQMVRAVLNRADSRGSVTTEDVRSALPCEIICAIPSDGKSVGLAVNQGVPVITSAPKSKVTKAIVELAETCKTRSDMYLEQLTDPTQVMQRQAKQSELIEVAQGSSRQATATKKQGLTRPEVVDPWVEVKQRIHDGLVEKLNLKSLDYATLGDREKAVALRKKTKAVIVDLLAKEAGGFMGSREQRERIIKEIVDEALGLGPLEDLLADDSISDILVNRRDQIYIERQGKLQLTNKKFVSDDQVRTVIERIVAPLGRRIDESTPMVDARLADGSRVNAIIPPLALRGPSISIRKFSRDKLDEHDLIGFGSVTQPFIDFLKAAVAARKNIIISGGTGSGKTTFLNVVSSFIPKDERIVTIEDAAELRMNQEHVVSLESRPANIEGKGHVTIRDLFRNALRMRPDRIVIGECRGGETLDMLQAMNTGHDGSLTTIHANSPHDVISRLDSLVLMSNIELPVRAIREQIVAAIDLIVHTARLSDGSRRVMAITEILGFKEGIEVELQDLLVFKQTGVDDNRKVLGNFMAVGRLPSFYDDLIIRGFDIPKEMFRALDGSLQE